MVLCGHNFGSAQNGISNGNNLRVDNNAHGHPVYQLLTDYQGNTADLDGSPNSYTGGAGVNNGPDFKVDPALSDFILPVPERVLE
ncbi:MAG: hypothetical protein JXR70_19175 [Spirochaetales bacterium]|nr:hypothetical protein [Spirochaetales bacterium]